MVYGRCDKGRTDRLFGVKDYRHEAVRFAIWENIQSADDASKQTGHQNAMRTTGIPAAEGEGPRRRFCSSGMGDNGRKRSCGTALCAPHVRDAVLRTLADVLQSCDLPMLYNQWCSVVRWEDDAAVPARRGVPVAGGTYFHARPRRQRRLRMLEICADVAENCMAMPSYADERPIKKVRRSRATYTVECMMHDGKALRYVGISRRIRKRHSIYALPIGQ